MITTEKTLKNLGFKYLFDYGIKPNHYEIYERKNIGYFYRRISINILEEVSHLRFNFEKSQDKYIYDDVRFHYEHNEIMKDIEYLEKKINNNICCANDYEEVGLE